MRHNLEVRNMNPLEIGSYTRRETCRVCLGRNVVSFLDYGNVPLAGDFLVRERLGQEKLYPLDLVVCLDCTLVQIANVVDATQIFTDYRYLSSVTTTLMSHFADYARILKDRVLRGSDGLVVEIGSNDGVLLSRLKELGVKAIGVDAAENVVRIAKAKGLNVQHGYFGTRVAREIEATHGVANVVTASNVFAHIDDLDEVIKGVDGLLAPDGKFIVEVHYLLDLLSKFQFDTVYHEHLCYYSLTALSRLFNRFDFVITDVDRLPMHGGSIRVYAQRRSAGSTSPSTAVSLLLDLEQEAGIQNLSTYEQFGRDVSECRNKLLQFILERKGQGRSLSGYGAAGRSTILLNFCGLDSKLIDYVVDESPSRIGRYIPGVGIPVVPREYFWSHPTDDCLVTAWNYRDEIVGKEGEFLANGGSFIVPLPELELLRGESECKTDGS